MATVETKTRITPEQLLALPDEERFELIDGELVERDMSQMTSWIGGEVLRKVGNHNEEKKRGFVMPADCGYQCFPWAPAKIRRPDASFIDKDRLPEGKPYETGYVPIAPDLGVEVVSPNDLFFEVKERVQDFLRAGTRLFWVLIPPSRTVRVYRADGSDTLLKENDDITGEDVLPGFRCKVGDFFRLPTEPAGPTA